MKHHVLRRAAAVLLALLLMVPMTVPVRAADVTGVTLDKKTLSVEEGKSAALTAAVEPENADNRDVTWTSSDETVATVKDGVVTGVKEGTATITVTADGGRTDTCEVTVTRAPVPVSGVTLDKKTLSIEEGESTKLTAAVEPENADNTAVSWSTSDEAVATVENGVVTGVKEGKATITVTTADGDKTDTCEVTVTRPPVPVTQVSLGVNAVQFNQLDSRTREITAAVTPSDADYDRVAWSSLNTQVVTVTGEGTLGLRAILTATGPGETTIRATAGGRFADCTVIVSGITLSRSSLTMVEGKAETLSVTGTFGEASGSATWVSSDPSVVAVGATSGRLTARSTGTATITASKGAYTATCRVTVVEDTTGLVDAGSMTAGSELDFSTLRTALNRVCVSGTSTNLSYITNLSVPPEQGVLHYRYVSEPDTGSGVGVTERYYYTASTGHMALDNLSFVPDGDYSGVAEIRYTGYGTNGQSVSGVIRVTVNSMRDIYYSTSMGMPVTFQLSDFSTACRNRTGRELSYVTFTLPQSDRGTLYYNYTGQSQYAELVTSATQYRRTGSPYVGSVTLVPAEGYSGTFSVTYQGVDTAGVSYTGRVTITVGDQHVTDEGNIYYTAEKGDPVTFQVEDFADACKKITGETLSHVRFTLPGSSQGVLYYGYRSAGSYTSLVNSGTNYYYKSYPALSSVAFVPSTSAPSQAVIDYTGYGVGGSSYSGTIYIELKEASQITVRYSTYSGKTVAFRSDDFNNACIAATGAPLNYVRFTLPTSAQGSLRYDYRSTTSIGTMVSTTTNYYRTGGARQIGSVSFLAGASYTGTVRFNYTGYSRDNDTFVGTVVIQVSAPAPKDINYSGTGASAISFSVGDLRTACNAVLSQELSYIQFTGLPSNSVGRLYLGYNGYGTGTAVAVNTRYYCTGSPSISQLSFVPRGGFEGVAVIPYTGVSTRGQQVSGLIKITIDGSGGSRYFTDMGNYKWAGTSADYLYLNDVVLGMSAGQYGPGLNIRRCDFVVMLCRAFGFSTNSTSSFPDVPADAYYARAVASAKNLGIVLGDGVNFMPSSQVTRQDAMVMLCRALTAVGWSVNGNTDSLSQFVDSGEISSYARTSVSALVQFGAVAADSSGRLRPRDPLTRVEMAVILHSLMTM